MTTQHKAETQRLPQESASAGQDATTEIMRKNWRDRPCP
jgi:hypothetical protein